MHVHSFTPCESKKVAQNDGWQGHQTRHHDLLTVLERVFKSSYGLALVDVEPGDSATQVIGS